MSNDNKKTPSMFPPHWEWAHYEPAFEEFYRRLGAVRNRETPHGPAIDMGREVYLIDYEGVKLQRWWGQAAQMGVMPAQEDFFNVSPDRAKQLEGIVRTHTATAQLELRGAQKRLTFFGHRPNLSESYNPPIDPLCPRNDDDWKQAITTDTNQQDLSPVLTNRETGRDIGGRGR